RRSMMPSMLGVSIDSKRLTPDDARAPMSLTEATETQGMQPATVSTGALCCYLLRLGVLEFGGPIDFVGYMQRDLLEVRPWIGGDVFRQGFAPSELTPGPLAAHLAIYVGWVRSRVFIDLQVVKFRSICFPKLE